MAQADNRGPWFILPVAVCMLADASLTLACQPDRYWQDPTRVEEGNSAWAALLAVGPAAFIGGFLLYAAALAGVLAWLSGALQKLLGMFVLLSHSYGAATWVHVKFSEDSYWWGLIILMLLQAGAFTAWWHIRPENKLPPTDS